MFHSFLYVEKIRRVNDRYTFGRTVIRLRHVTQPQISGKLKTAAGTTHESYSAFFQRINPIRFHPRHVKTRQTDRQWMFNVTLRGIRATILTVEKQ